MSKLTPEESRRLIEASGGNKAFAMQIGIDVKTDTKYAARISRWKSRGIPPDVQLEKANELAALKVSASRRGML